jgi:perosamine synthetase
MKRINLKEYYYVIKVLIGQFRSSKSSFMTNNLEQEFKRIFNVNFAISHINGTATMHSILEAADIGYGDEVIVPPLTMSSTTFAVLHANATPVYADVDEKSFLIDPNDIEKKITYKTKAIITVSLYGLSPDMDKINLIAKKHNLLVIEDNAECFMGTYKGRLVGTLGDAASYSFQSSKHITSGEGGMVLTNNSHLADRIRKVSSLGYAGVSSSKSKISKSDIQDPDYERHVSLGWNYRIPELCSAVALAQLENYNKLVETRIKSALLLNEVVKDCEWLVAQSADYDHSNSYWAFTVLLKRKDISWKAFRDRFIQNGGDGIYAAWKLSYQEPFYLNESFLGKEKNLYKNKINHLHDCPVAERIQPRLLQFKTNYWNISDAKRQAKILAKTISDFEKNYPFH